ncbi:MAG: hypothetical protein ACLPOA_06765 [Methylocella sp.]
MHGRHKLVAAKCCNEISRQRCILFKQPIDITAALYVPDKMREWRWAEAMQVFNAALKSLA